MWKRIRPPALSREELQTSSVRLDMVCAVGTTSLQRETQSHHRGNGGGYLPVDDNGCDSLMYVTPGRRRQVDVLWGIWRKWRPFVSLLVMSSTDLTGLN